MSKWLNLKLPEDAPQSKEVKEWLDIVSGKVQETIDDHIFSLGAFGTHKSTEADPCAACQHLADTEPWFNLVLDNGEWVGYEKVQSPEHAMEVYESTVAQIIEEYGE